MQPQETLKAKPRPVEFKPDVFLVLNEEFQVAFGFSELLDEYCIAERWDIDSNWFHSPPELTRAKIMSYISANMKGTDYDSLIDLGVELGFVFLTKTGIRIKDDAGLSVEMVQIPSKQTSAAQKPN